MNKYIKLTLLGVITLSLITSIGCNKDKVKDGLDDNGKPKVESENDKNKTGINKLGTEKVDKVDLDKDTIANETADVVLEETPGEKDELKIIERKVDYEKVNVILDDKSTPKESYDKIADAYIEEIERVTPGLVAKFKEQVKDETKSAEFVEFMDDKIGVIAELTNDANKEMTDIMYSKGTGEYSEIERWEKRLNKVRMSSVKQITDVFDATRK